MWRRNGRSKVLLLLMVDLKKYGRASHAVRGFYIWVRLDVGDTSSVQIVGVRVERWVGIDRIVAHPCECWV